MSDYQNHQQYQFQQSHINDVNKIRAGLGSIVNNFDSGLLRCDKCYTDIYEQEGILNIEMELPGVQRDDLDVKLEGSTLQIYGRVDQENEFQQGFPLPDQVDLNSPNNITSNFENGLLTIKLPLKGPLS